MIFRDFVDYFPFTSELTLLSKCFPEAFPVPYKNLPKNILFDVENIVLKHM